MSGARGGPLVSAIVPTYGRRPDLFREAVESVQAQTHDAVELVVVDDSPGAVSSWVDDSLSGIECARCLRDGDNDGPGAARNAGIEAATGEYLAFLDDDDTWIPSKLERQLTVFEREAVGVAHSALRHVRGDETIRTTSGRATGDVTRAILEGASVGIFSALMVRASVVEHGGPIDERLPYLEDREWSLRLSQHCEFGGIDAPAVNRRHGDHEQLTDDYEALRDVAYPLFLQKHTALAASYGRLCRRRFVASLTRTVVNVALDQGRYGEARRFALRALRAYPLDPTNYAYLFAALGGRRTHHLARRVHRTTGR